MVEENRFSMRGRIHRSEKEFHVRNQFSGSFSTDAEGRRR